MKYHPCFPTVLDLDATQRTVLHSRRNPLHVLRAQWEAKVDKTLHYFQRYGLSGAVVGVSGGIDSALALAFLKAMRERSPGTLRKIVPLLLPIYEDDAATGQRQATERAATLCTRWGLTPHVVDMTCAHQALSQALHASQGIQTPWTRGQLVAYLRTPALYNATSMLTEDGFPAVVVGTTNYDEGAYIGYFGKASDGLVDIQVLSDWHKHDVYTLSEWLGVTDDILSVTPTGDMFDGRVDEQVFGFTYDALEYDLRSRLLQSMPVDSAIRARVEALHQYNAHKYMTASPAIHMDVNPRQLQHGWKTTVWYPEG